MSIGFQGYTAGAVKSDGWSVSINEFKASGQPITLGSLFKPNEPISEILSTLCFQSLTSLTNESSLEILEKATEPRESSFKDFSLSKKGILFDFDLSKIGGSDGYGTAEALIPYSKLREFLKPEFVPKTVQPLTEAPLNSTNLAEQLAIIRIASYSNWMSLNTDDAHAYRQRGVWYKRINRPSAADADFARAKELESANDISSPPATTTTTTTTTEGDPQKSE
ncbi:MAG TPA: hypothetical protein V6C81_29885 [Planktothrix sp.]